LIFNHPFLELTPLPKKMIIYGGNLINFGSKKFENLIDKIIVKYKNIFKILMTEPFIS